MGTMAGGHPQGDNQERHRHPGGQRPGRGQTPSPARSLPPTLRRGQSPATSARHEPQRLARAETRGNSHVRFLGGPGAAMRPAYPADPAVIPKVGRPSWLPALAPTLSTWTYFKATNPNSTMPTTAINPMGSPLRGLLPLGADTKIHTHTERRPTRIPRPIHGLRRSRPSSQGHRYTLVAVPCPMPSKRRYAGFKRGQRVIPARDLSRAAAVMPDK